jgi:signal transduction histidine kinase
VVVLTVDDDGPGVPPERRQDVFERFVRLDDARSRDAGGAGLGLAVVAATAMRSGGDVELTDSPLGGARVVVRLPSAG